MSVHINMLPLLKKKQTVLFTVLQILSYLLLGMVVSNCRTDEFNGFATLSETYRSSYPSQCRRQTVTQLISLMKHWGSRLRIYVATPVQPTQVLPQMIQLGLFVSVLQLQASGLWQKNTGSIQAGSAARTQALNQTSQTDELKSKHFFFTHVPPPPFLFEGVWGPGRRKGSFSPLNPSWVWPQLLKQLNLYNHEWWQLKQVPLSREQPCEAQHRHPPGQQVTPAVKCISI